MIVLVKKDYVQAIENFSVARLGTFEDLPEEVRGKMAVLDVALATQVWVELPDVGKLVRYSSGTREYQL